MATSRPKVVLFDIGGVVVTSPMLAIAAHETTHALPPGWINHAISASGPQGAWARLERGEIALDDGFFALFGKDLGHDGRWREYYGRWLERERQHRAGSGAEGEVDVAAAADADADADADAAKGEGVVEEPAPTIPPPPHIDAEALYWSMMRISRTPDPHIYPALLRLRRLADTDGTFLVAALTNTSIFPAAHTFSDPLTAEGRFSAELRKQFDVFVSSAHIGMRKPEQRIYEYTVAELDRVARGRGMGGVRAEEVLFLDDIGANLRVAREVGMRTVKVRLGRTGEAVGEVERVMGLDLGVGGDGDGEGKGKGKGAKL